VVARADQLLDQTYESHLREAWQEYGDPRGITSVVEVSAKVSTNRVYRLHLSDSGSVVAKVSSYGSYFLFREDHDRIHRTRDLLQSTRWAGLLADVLTARGPAPFTVMAAAARCSWSNRAYGEVAV